MIVFKTRWSSPSNIAFVKYWGKRDIQIPQNSSLSMTLSNCFTDTEVHLVKNGSGKINTFAFADNQDEFSEKPDFIPRIQKFIDYLIESYKKFNFSVLKSYDLEIKSRNSFPHSTGIASSASSFSSLSLCLVDLVSRIEGKSFELSNELQEIVSECARLGSGSASRSVFSNFAIWGENSHQFSNSFATEFNSYDQYFSGLCDSVLIVHSGVKTVSSSVGHKLMENNPFANIRYQTANTNLMDLIQAMKTKNLQDFIYIMEKEALTLHGLMLTSGDGYLLLQPGSLDIINKVRMFRNETGCFITFTIDAGPNIHLIYHQDDKDLITNFINEELLQHCHNNQVIHDQIGKGPLRLEAR